MAPTEQVIGLITVVFLGFGAAYVILRNIIAKRHWMARKVLQFLLAYVIALLTIWVIVWMGFRGWWVSYIGHTVGLIVVFVLVAPLSLRDWSKRRKRGIPKDVRKKVIERHKLLTGSYDPSREEIDHVYPFSEGGGNTIDNLHIILKDDNRRKSSEEPRYWIGPEQMSRKSGPLLF